MSELLAADTAAWRRLSAWYVSAAGFAWYGAVGGWRVVSFDAVAFKKQAAPLPVPASPEALYPVLPHGRDAPRELWPWQIEVLRRYDGLHGDPADVAIELPTGAGKTLVGCLIAEWRRRKFRERAAYVAPNRQLAQCAAMIYIPGLIYIKLERVPRWALQVAVSVAGVAVGWLAGRHPGLLLFK